MKLISDTGWGLARRQYGGLRGASYVFRVEGLPAGGMTECEFRVVRVIYC